LFCAWFLAWQCFLKGLVECGTFMRLLRVAWMLHCYSWLWHSSRQWLLWYSVKYNPVDTFTSNNHGNRIISTVIEKRQHRPNKLIWNLLQFYLYDQPNYELSGVWHSVDYHIIDVSSSLTLEWLILLSGGKFSDWWCNCKVVRSLK